MDYEIIWSKKSISCLQEILSYLNSVSIRQTDKFRIELLKTIERLKKFPTLGHSYEVGDDIGPVNEILCQRYRVFYSVDTFAHRVEILLIWHSARDEPKFS